LFPSRIGTSDRVRHQSSAGSGRNYSATLAARYVYCPRCLCFRAARDCVWHGFEQPLGLHYRDVEICSNPGRLCSHLPEPSKVFKMCTHTHTHTRARDLHFATKELDDAPLWKDWFQGKDAKSVGTNRASASRPAALCYRFPSPEPNRIEPKPQPNIQLITTPRCESPDCSAFSLRPPPSHLFCLSVFWFCFVLFCFTPSIPTGVPFAPHP